MPDETPQNKGLIDRFLDLPKDSVPKTVFVAVALCLVASMVVSAAAVALRPIQEINSFKDRQSNILQVAGLYDPNVDVLEAFEVFEPHLVDLTTGELSEDFNPLTFDAQVAATDANLSIALDYDPALIGRRANYATVYFLRNDDGSLDKVILPIHGAGLWSTLYGFIALGANGNDVHGLQFYQHGETPGLGGEIDNPRWRALWAGRELRDENGDLQITVAKTAPAAGDQYHVDALAGATLTSVGVDNLVRFWMGENGFGPFLTKLNSGEIS